MELLITLMITGIFRHEIHFQTESSAKVITVPCKGNGDYEIYRRRYHNRAKKQNKIITKRYWGSLHCKIRIITLTFLWDEETAFEQRTYLNVHFKCFLSSRLEINTDDITGDPRAYERSQQPRLYKRNVKKRNRHQLEKRQSTESTSVDR